MYDDEMPIVNLSLRADPAASLEESKLLLKRLTRPLFSRRLD